MRKEGKAGQLRAGPEDVDLFFNGGEVLVAGGEGGFAMDGEGGGKAVGVGEFVVGAEFGGCAGEVEIGIDDFDGELCNVFDDFAGDAGAMGAPSGIVHFAPVDDGHEQLTFACYAEMDEVLNFVRAGTVFEEGHDGAGVENDSLHGFEGFMALCSSQLALTFAVIEKNFQRGWITFQGSAEAADKFRGERLKDQAVLFLEEGDLRAFADGVLAAEFCGDDELALGGNGGDFVFHRGS